MNCPQCQRSVQVGASFCDHCGNRLAGSARTVQASPPHFPATGQGVPAGFAPTVMASPSSASSKASAAIYCPQCGANAYAGQAFCEECGGKLATVQPSGGQVPSWQPPQPQQPPAYQSYQEPASHPHPPRQTPPPQRPLPPSQKPAYQPPPRSAPPVQIPPTVAYKAPPKKPKPAPPIPQTVVYKAPPVKQPKLIVAGSGMVLDLGGQKEVLIGREDPIAGIFPQVDMTAHRGKESGVSRQHAKISQQGHQWMIEDLNSVNHTYVNKKRVTPGYPHPLNKGDEIRLGRAILRFELF